MLKTIWYLQDITGGWGHGSKYKSVMSHPFVFRTWSWW